MINKPSQSKQAPTKKKSNAESIKNKENQIIESEDKYKNDQTLSINEILRILNPESVFGSEYKPANVALYRDILADQKQPPPNKKELCRNWQQGNCQLAQQCKFLHDLQPIKKQQKMTECLTFNKNGFCTKGEACEMIHSNNSSTMFYQIQLNNTSQLAQQQLSQESRLLVFIRLEEKARQLI